ncbi:MAG: phosphoribosylanthranilate isomerase [Gemmatimonadaceae bacterium]
MPSGPGMIDEALIAGIAADVRGDAETYLLTSHRLARDIVEQHARCRTTTLQLVDCLASLDEYLALRHQLPDVLLVQVIHVVDESALEEAHTAATFVDRILLDSGNPRLPVKELGGTGRTHNWEISRRIRDEIGLPVLLAGGLTPDNVRDAIHIVEPFGVDVCTGVRERGHLNEYRLKRFVSASAGME